VVDDFDGVPVYGTEDTPPEVVDLGELGGDPPTTTSYNTDDEPNAVTADDLLGAEESSTVVGDDSVRVVTRMHPSVVALVNRDSRYIPLEDYDESRQRLERLPVKLSADELHQLDKEIQELVKGQRRMEEEHKLQRKALGQAEATLKGELHCKVDLRSDGVEIRNVPIAHVADLKGNRRLVVRLDTGEVVPGRERAMTSSEMAEARQVRLF
jgi:hypothetical protein